MTMPPQPPVWRRIYLSIAPPADGRVSFGLSLEPPMDAGGMVAVLFSKGVLHDSWPVEVKPIIDPSATPELKGAKGDAGSRGVAGPKGDPGNVGADGAPGSAGLSAYQVARAGGYGGTQTQWLASLKGADGAKGDAGASAATSLGTLAIGETVALAVGVGIRRITVATPAAWGVKAGDNLLLFPTAVPGLGFAVHDVIATAANTIVVGISTPALAVLATYSITCRVVRINT